MQSASPDLVHVLDHDTELLDGLDERVADQLRRRIVARKLWADPGPWEPSFDADAVRGHLGLLVIDGLLVRTLELAGRQCSEVVGPGDLLRPWDGEDAGAASVESASGWRVLRPTVMASLDAGFALSIARWPTITAALLRRSTQRCRSLVYQATVAHVRHAETRLLLVLWHLADRWGRVTPQGVVVPVPLTHQLLAQLSCLQRPTVSAAVTSLDRAEKVSRLPDGGWLLHGEPPGAAAAPEDDDPQSRVPLTAA